MQCYFFHLHLLHVSRTTHVRTCWSAQSCAWSSLPPALIDCETWMLTLVRRLKAISKKLSPSEYFSTTDCGTRWEASHPTIMVMPLKLKQVCYIFTSVELPLKEAVTVSLKSTFRGTTVVWTCCSNSADSNGIYLFILQIKLSYHS